MTFWHWLLLAIAVIIWLYFAAGAATLGVLRAVKAFFMNEIQHEQEKRNGKKTS